MKIWYIHIPAIKLPETYKRPKVINMSGKYLAVHLATVKKIYTTFKAQPSADALFFYTHDLRTPLFMLQGICRIYKSVYDENVFAPLAAAAKEIEDALGAVDYSDQLLEGLSNRKNISKKTISFLEKEKVQKITLLKKLTLQRNALEQNILIPFEEAIKKTDWLTTIEETKKIKKQYKKECQQVSEFMEQKVDNFVDMELDVHELRRKLRWLSIYVHAFKGLFDFRLPEHDKEKFKKYLTEDVLQSKFNKIEADPTLHRHIEIKKNQFLALSYLIAAIGQIKDEGLMIDGLATALGKTNTRLHREKAVDLAGNLLQCPNGYMQTLKQKTNELSIQFIQDNILKKLL